MRQLYVNEANPKSIVFIDYDGSQLKPHFLRNTFKFKGSGVGWFVGKCDVRSDGHMVDLEDVEMGHGILSGSMLHFVGEFFDNQQSLERMVFRQRMFARIAAQYLDKFISGRNLRVEGDDLYHQSDDGEKDSKLSVSIATISLISGLFHFGINIYDDETPDYVQTGSLYKMGLVGPNEASSKDSICRIANSIVSLFADELYDIDEACCKVLPV